MASFINFEVGVDDEDQISDDEVSDNNCNIDSFIDDNVQKNDNNFYRHFDSIERNIDDVLAEEYEKSLEEIDDDCSNLHETSEEENEVDDFQNEKQRLDKFKETLFLKNIEEEDIFFLIMGNVLVVGKTSCKKPTFLQKLGINKFFWKLVKTEWVSGIEIEKSGKAEIQSCFDNPVEVHVAKEPDKLASLIETFQLRTRDLVDDDNVNLNNSIFGENKKMDRLIVMDDVSGVAEIF